METISGIFFYLCLDNVSANSNFLRMKLLVRSIPLSDCQEVKSHTVSRIFYCCQPDKSEFIALLSSQNL